MKKKLLPIILLGTLISTTVKAQKSIEISHTFEWVEPVSGEQNISIQKFTGASFSDEYPGLPFYLTQAPVPSYGNMTVEILEAGFSPLSGDFKDINNQVGPELQFKTSVEIIRNQFTGKLLFCPIIRNGGAFEKLDFIRLRVVHQPEPLPFPPRPKNKTNSVLRDGDIYKIAVPENGLYKLTYNFLKNELGIPIDIIDPKTIKLFGNGGGIIPVFLTQDRFDDLEENQIFISGEADGKFDASDYLLFYGQGPDRWSYSDSEEQFNLEKNIYDDANYYFLKISAGNGARVNSQASLSPTDFTATVTDDYARYEVDRVNLLHEWNLSQGSGQNWYGDYFKVIREYEYKNIFSFPDLVLNNPVRVKAQMALRATERGRFRINIQGQTLESNLSGRISRLADNEIDFASLTRLEGSFLPSSSDLSLKVSYPFPTGPGDGSEGWLDYLQINARRNLKMQDAQMPFRLVESRQYNSTTFELTGANERLHVWDITDPLRPRQQEFTIANGTLRFGQTTGGIIRQFIAFDPSANLLTATAAGKVENQNIHALNNVEMLIVCHVDFQEAAQELARHRSDFSGLSAAVVRVDQIYNEFSSGRQDPAAIRDFAKMLYDRSPQFKYLLLFGDGSFDPRNIYKLGNNFVPVYEQESLHPIFAFPSDDFYGLLANTSTFDPLSGALTVAVGRLPATSAAEARSLVRKIIHYDTSPNTLGDWRNRMVFVGDDEDFNTHVRDADLIANLIGDANPSLNIEKIYLDAFPQVATPGDDRYPAVNEAINQAIFKGALVFTYLGHGGSSRLAQEVILDIPAISSWTNTDRQPLFMTATCSFTGYDDAGFTTAGEKLILNDRGGAIALMTTVRAVYASLNADLTEVALESIFNRQGSGRIPTLGDAILTAKNSRSGSTFTTNARKFALIGDPAQQLALPPLQVRTTLVNERPVDAARNDTLRALQKVKISGVISNAAGQVQEDFNGVLFPTIFDKATLAQTLGQDEQSRVMPFKVQKNIIFKGRATVNRGAFEFTFVIPRDINYSLGNGKISYYAFDQPQMLDASGSFQNIVIGGTDPGAFRDDQGPEVDVFMNTTDFVFGGLTDANPTLLIKLRDDNGINVVGNSIGHDLEAILNEDTQNSLLLNDFYESELDDFTRGEVKYPLNQLADGLHTMRVKAWDVANNSAEGYTEFVVAGSGEVALERVLNYPNPFTDFTCFQFDHNLTNQEIDILIHIYTISGRLVKTLEETVFSDGAIRQDNCLAWDGKDDFGDPLARGVYLYKVKIRGRTSGTTVQTGESSFEKLVILK